MGSIPVGTTRLKINSLYIQFYFYLVNTTENDADTHSNRFTICRLTDFYSLFYLQIIIDLSNYTITSWVALSQTQK